MINVRSAEVKIGYLRTLVDPDYQGIAGGTFDSPTFSRRLERSVFARSKPNWLAIPPEIEFCQATPD